MALATPISIKNEALNVAVGIGLLTQDKPKFNLIKLGLKVERITEADHQKFKLFDTKTRKIIFLLTIQGSSIKILEFKRGAWEALFEQYTKDYGKNKKDETDYKLKTRPRTRRPTTRIKE